MSHFEVLIVGSGPVGSAFARHLAARGASRNMLMVEAGADLQLSGGANMRNLPPAEREAAYAQARAFPLARVGDMPEGALNARPGTFLARPDALPGDPGMPAAAMSSNLGGMGAHWTCACPRPGDSECIGFLDPERMDAALTRAEEYLSVTQKGFPETRATRHVVSRLHEAFGAGRSPERQPQPMPLACRPDGDRPKWAGVDMVLGPLATPEGRASAGVGLRSGTLCRRLLTEGNRVTGAELVDLASGRIERISAGAVMVAGDALRTPQLLHASGIRPAALGRWLNDQPQVIALIELDLETGTRAEDRALMDGRDGVSGVSWLPFHDPEFPFHAQLMQMDTSPIALPPLPDGTTRPVVGLGLFLAKDVQEDDRIVFDEATDALGMPRFRLDYRLTERDRARVELAMDWAERIGAALGRIVPGGAPMLLPAGSSLHYQGTHRIGPADDGSSVCDAEGRVWGYDNLYLGGNGAIPTATACNPTLTAVALALLAADRVIERHL